MKLGHVVGLGKRRPTRSPFYARRVVHPSTNPRSVGIGDALQDFHRRSSSVANAFAIRGRLSRYAEGCSGLPRFSECRMVLKVGWSRQWVEFLHAV